MGTDGECKFILSRLNTELQVSVGDFLKSFSIDRRKFQHMFQLNKHRQQLTAAIDQFETVGMF